MKRIAFIILLFLQNLLPLLAQHVVKDAQVGCPVAFASVFNQSGTFLGMTSAAGILPAIGNATAIRIQHVAYKPLLVDDGQLSDELLMTPIVIPVSEVVVNKPKSFCLKLTGYYRELRLNVDTTGHKPPVEEYVHGVMHVYLFNDGSKPKTVVTSSNYELYSSVGLGSPISIGNISPIEYIKRGKRYTTKEKGNYFEVYKDSTMVGTLTGDTIAKTIRLDYDHMAPDTIHEGHVLLFKYILKESKSSMVYRMTPYDKVSQSSLQAYRSSIRCWLKAFGKVYDQWSFSEFFPSEAVYLTKEEYKHDRKAMKAKRREGATLEQLESLTRETNVPSLSPEICLLIEKSKAMKK